MISDDGVAYFQALASLARSSKYDEWVTGQTIALMNLGVDPFSPIMQQSLKDEWIKLEKYRGV